MTRSKARQQSPCNSICVLNDDDICVGCYRSGTEISRWGSYTDEERELVLEQVHVRAQKMNPFLQ